MRSMERAGSLADPDMIDMVVSVFDEERRMLDSEGVGGLYSTG